MCKIKMIKAIKNRFIYKHIFLSLWGFFYLVLAYICSLYLYAKFQNMENNRFWGEICPKNIWITNTWKTYTSKPESAYNNMSFYQISVNLENIRFWDQICPNKCDWQKFKKKKINIKVNINLNNSEMVKAVTLAYEQNPDGDISDFRISGQSLIKRNCQNARTNDDTDMKLGPEKLNIVKKDDVISEFCDAIVFFLIYSQSEAIRKPDWGSIVCKTNISWRKIFYLTKTESKNKKTVTQF